MAPTRPAPERGRENLYDSPILNIYVNGKATPFKVHKAALQVKSSFLKKVKPEHPRKLRELEDIKGESLDDSINVKDDSDSAGDVEDNDRIQDHAYNLRDDKVRDNVFEIFVDYLYNREPSKITSFKQAKVAISAYILALKYDAIPLQNSLIDRTREYHSSNRFSLDLLYHMVNRSSDTGCAMTKYLVAQMAYDLSSDGYDEFAEENTLLQNWVVEKTREVREDVFKAIVEIAMTARKGKKVTDPADVTAKTRCKWHVHENLEKCAGYAATE